MGRDGGAVSEERTGRTDIELCIKASVATGVEREGASMAHATSMGLRTPRPPRLSTWV
jgi:hypothetical protein